MFRPEYALANFDGALQEWLSAGVESEVAVHVPHDLHHLRLSFRIFREAIANVL